MLAKLLLALCAVSATSLGLAIGGRRCNAHLVRPAPTLSVKMVAPTVGTSTAPEKTNTVSAKLGLDAGMLRASRVAAESFKPAAIALAEAAFEGAAAVAGDAAIAGAEAGAKQFAEQFEPTIFLFGGACIFTAGFFVPPTAAREAGMVIGLLGLSFMCYGAKMVVKQFEPTISLFGGACIFTAAFFVPPTAARGAGMVIGLLGLSFMCYGAYVKHALHAKDAASPGPAASGLDPHPMPSRDKGGKKT